MDTYSALLFVHISAAILWVGGAASLQVFAALAKRRGADRRAELVEDFESVGKLVLGPSALLVLASGIWMVVDGYWSFSDAWILFGLGLFASAFVLVATFIVPEGARLTQAIAEHGAESRTAAAHVDRLLLFARVELAIFALILFDMAVKPTLDKPVTIVAAAAAFLAAVITIVATSRPSRSRPAIGPALPAAN